MTTPQQLARLYAETLRSPPNAWGQHRHPFYGQAHNIMFALSREIGLEEAHRLIDAEMNKGCTR